MLPTATISGWSTAHMRAGVLWKAFDTSFGVDDSPTLVWRAPTLTMHPDLDPAIVEQAYQDDPVAAEAEFGAQFRSDLQAYVAPEVVDACIAHGCYEREPEPGIRYEAFCDPSGGSSDSMVLALVHHDTRTGRAVLHCLREVKPPFNPASVCAEFAETLKRYGLRRVIGDKYAGTWPASKFAESASPTRRERGRRRSCTVTRCRCSTAARQNCSTTASSACSSSGSSGA